MRTVHLLVELFVKHHPSIESIAIMQSFFVAIPTTTLGQDGVRCNSRRWRRSMIALQQEKDLAGDLRAPRRVRWQRYAN
jgi:hypothetical protein